MSNPPRQKGTSWEKKLIEKYLWRIWPTVKRAPNMGINDYGDFINVDGWLIEAKNHKNWRLPEWIKIIYTKIERQGRTIGEAPWVLAFKGDLRRKWMKEDLVVTPGWLFWELVRVAREYEKSLEPADTRTTEEWLADIRARGE